MEDRYVMLVDENGEPYLAHAGFLQRARTAAGNAVNSVRSAVAGRGGTRQNHKYLMKIGSPDNPRYLYTQEEVRAYLRGGRNALNNMANKAGQTAKNAVNTVKKTTGKAVDAFKDKAGVDERQRAEEAWSKVPKQLSSKDEKGMQAFREANKAQDEYRKTPLGRAEYLTERAQEIATGADGTAKDIANKAASSLKSAGERMREEFRKRNEERKAETEPKSEEQDWKDNRPAGRTRNVTGKADPIEAKKKAKYGEYNENDPDFSDANYEKAKRDYDKTALGAVDRIKPELKSKDVAETARTNGEKGQEQKKLESSRKEAENATKREDELFANLIRLTKEYEQKYGDNWKNRLSEDEKRAYEIAENRFDGSLRMSKEKWDSYSKQVQDFEQKWNTKK